jgi:hypothetical protein
LRRSQGGRERFARRFFSTACCDAQQIEFARIRSRPRRINPFTAPTGRLVPTTRAEG